MSYLDKKNRELKNHLEAFQENIKNHIGYLNKKLKNYNWALLNYRALGEALGELSFRYTKTTNKGVLWFREKDRKTILIPEYVEPAAKKKKKKKLHGLVFF